VATLKAGDVVTFTDSRCIKILNDFDLNFGGLKVPTHNYAENYPGVYGLWLKRTADGWSLVFSSQGDLWGTQYDPSYDAQEVPLQHATLSQPEPILNLTFTEEGNGGVFRMAWGTDEWTAKFTTE
jgi:hypothetical protein